MTAPGPRHPQCSLPRDARGQPHEGGAGPRPGLHQAPPGHSPPWATQPSLTGARREVAPSPCWARAQPGGGEPGTARASAHRCSCPGLAPQGWRDLVRGRTEKVSPRGRRALDRRCWPRAGRAGTPFWMAPPSCADCVPTPWRGRAAAPSRRGGATACCHAPPPTRVQGPMPYTQPVQAAVAAGGALAPGDGG